MNDTTTQCQHHLAKRLSFRTLSEEPDGAAILRDVPLLAAGQWHDSLTPYPTVYTEDNLSKFTVEGTAGYKSHAFSHPMDEEIGEAINIRYEPKQKAIMTDLLFHCETQASRDVLAMIQRRLKANRPAYVSIEMLTRDIPTDNGIEAQDITITGWIATTEPACKKCAIPKQQTEHHDMTDEKNEKQKQKAEANPEDEKQKDAQTANTAGAADGNKNQEDKKDPESEKQQDCDEEDKTKKLEARVTELEAQMHKLTAELDGRIKALESKPNGREPIKVTAPSTAPVVEYNTHYF